MRSNVESRGIEVRQDRINAAFPGYDTHGNAKALLTRSGSSFSTTAWRHYDVWGSLRTGSALGGASQRYCANLGHVADDESGLVYMRARFYEPWTGRFVSEDPTMDKPNWYAYCQNNPTNRADSSGGYSEDEVTVIRYSAISKILVLLSSVAAQAYFGCTASKCFHWSGYSLWFNGSVDMTDDSVSVNFRNGTIAIALSTHLMGCAIDSAFGETRTANCIPVILTTVSVAAAFMALLALAEAGIV
jgi:RHS repeat-associated protein